MSTGENKRARGFAVGEITVIALVAVMILLGKSVLRLPIQVSGHGGVLWIAAMLIGRAAVRRPGATTLMGFVGGVLVALMQPGDAGFFFTVGKYLLPGITLDVLAPLVGRLDQVTPAILAGAAAHSSKLVVDVLQQIVAGLPAALVVAGLTIDSVLHIAFGALGGLLAALTLQALIRARIPQLRGFFDEGAVR